MANRISYLQFLSQNKNAFMSDIAVVQNEDGGVNHSSDVTNKMNKLLMLAEDPKIYY